ncbi:MAG: sensor histidine kinase [Treponemataceae bacterium]|nr:sensor histidine kinase [Treponemataceae bacterium]
MKFHKFGHLLPFKKTSIKKRLQISSFYFVFLMIIPIVYSISVSSIHTSQYDRIITNVSRANRIIQTVKVDISDEIWDIVAGKKTFEEGKQYEILNDIKNGISEMMLSTEDANNRSVLEVATRAVQTLEKYVNILGTQINENASVSDNEQILEEVRGCAALIYDILQDFIVAEIETAALTNESIKHSFRTLTIIQIVIITFMVAISIYTSVSVSESIRKPIQDMETLSTCIAEGQLDARIKLPNVPELDPLSENLNIMAEKIQELLDENIKEQKNLQKAEMKTLQAQITPHFLYNTLDTIIWLAESERKEEVIEITKAFSNFFRISLSKGHEWIQIEQEFDHVRSYLTIQKIRYRDILDYEIDFDPTLKGRIVLKLILQPLVENAIYHGIKNKRGRGKLKVSAKLAENDYIFFCVEDNGIGFTSQRLEEVLFELSDRADPENLKSVYGLYNVNKRLKLYYDMSACLSIKSEHGKGTSVSFKIPSKFFSGVEDV